MHVYEYMHVPISRRRDSTDRRRETLIEQEVR
jgi:hypothetical protein